MDNDIIPSDGAIVRIPGISNSDSDGRLRFKLDPGWYPIENGEGRVDSEYKVLIVAAVPPGGHIDSSQKLNTACCTGAFDFHRGVVELTACDVAPRYIITIV